MLPSTWRSSAASEGSLWEVELVRAEAGQGFGLFSSLPGEFGRSRYQAVVTFLGSRVGKLQPNAPCICDWLVVAFSAVPSGRGMMGFTPAVAQGGVVLPEQ